MWRSAWVTSEVKRSRRNGLSAGLFFLFALADNQRMRPSLLEHGLTFLRKVGGAMEQPPSGKAPLVMLSAGLFLFGRLTSDSPGRGNRESDCIPLAYRERL